jgi:hypothetical protein
MFESDGLVDSKLAYLVSTLNEQAKAFQRRAVWYRWRYYISTMTTVTLSPFITVIAGCRPDFGTVVNELSGSSGASATSVVASNLTLGLAALSTVVSAWGAFFSP